MGRACSQSEEGRNAFKILTAECREGNIRMDLKEIGINTRNWVDSAKDRDYWRDLLNATVKLRVL